MAGVLGGMREATRNEDWHRVLQLADSGCAKHACHADAVEAEYLAGFAALRSGANVDAEQRLTALLQREPGHAMTRVALANTYFRTRRKAACLHLLLEGLANDPDNQALRSLVVPLLTHNGDIDEARTLNDQLLARFPDSPDLHLDAAHIAHEQHDPDRAIHFYRRTLAAQPENHRAWCGLGLSLQQTGALTDALTAHKQALVLQPRCGHYHYNVACMAAFDPHPSHAITLENLLAASKDKDDRANLLFALARLRERAGDIEGTWQALVDGNAERRRTFTHDREKFSQRVDNIRQLLATPRFDLGLPDDPEAAAPIFIVGLPRSGSTLLEQMLSNHPEVTGKGEQTWLNDLLDQHESGTLDQALLKAVRDAYLVRVNSPTARFVDKMPSNLVYTGLIHLMFPRARVILIERDRDATLFSCFRQQFVDQRWTFDAQDIARYEHDYERLVQFWDTAWPGVLLHVSFEDLVTRPESTIRRLLDTCDLSWHDACLHPETNPAPVATASAQQVRQPVSDREADRLRPWLAHFRAMMAAPRAAEKTTPGA